MRLRNVLPAIAPLAAVAVALMVLLVDVGAKAAVPLPRSCAVAYRVTDTWPSGFSSAVTVINTGDQTISRWTLMWTFPNGQVPIDVSAGVASSEGSTVSVTSRNAPIAPSAMAMIGLSAAGNSRETRPQIFTLNGVACTQA